MALSNWQKRRSDFNHDWLRNNYVQALGRWIRLLDEQIEDDGFAQRFVRELFPSWESQSGEVTEIIELFEDEMSPKVLFARCPFLLQVTPQTKAWLVPLVDALWRYRTGVPEMLNHARECLETVNRTFNHLASHMRPIEKGKEIQILRPFRDEFANYRRHCVRLSEAISRFPSEVKPL